jgi:hypothetical protein
MPILSFESKPKPLNKNWWTPTKKEWVPHLWLDNRENWSRQVDDEGKPWKSLSPSYAKWKAERYGNLPELRISGEMLDQSSIFVRGSQFFVRTTDAGIYNQFGTEKMPARPWMGVPLRSLDTLAEIALENILR